ncbi:MAG: DUF4747 family protein [Bacteroidota bacterium]
MPHLKYLIFNVKVLPVRTNQTERYSEIIQNWYDRGFRIQTPGDNQHYYVLITHNKIGDGVAHYGVIAKFVKWEALDFVNEKGELVEFEIPDDVQARINEYEFVFIPECHRLALITNGKIDQNVKRNGAPLKRMREIVNRAFANLTEDDVFVDVEQTDQIFERIFTNPVNYLEAEISFTNNDISEEGNLHLDDLMRDAHVNSFFTRMKPGGQETIDTAGDLPRSVINLAQSNGYVRARITSDDGSSEIINTREHPRKLEVPMVSKRELKNATESSNIESEGAVFIIMAKRIYDQLMRIFRP